MPNADQRDRVFQAGIPLSACRLYSIEKNTMPTLADVLARRFLPPEWLEKLAASCRAYSTWFEEHGETVMGVLASVVVSLDELKVHELGRFIQVDRRLVSDLVERGWYPDPRMAPIQLALLSSYSDSEPDAIEEIMKEVFRERLDSIEAKLVVEYPKRAAILQEAFDAHREFKYNLSVPVLLTQADGIWHDRIDLNLFSGDLENAINALAVQVKDANSREFVFALITPDWPLVLSKKNRPDDFSGLNRHLVMHGEATDYGTEDNSLKAVAFINYCAFVLAESEQPVTTSRKS